MLSSVAGLAVTKQKEPTYQGSTYSPCCQPHEATLHIEAAARVWLALVTYIPAWLLADITYFTAMTVADVKQHTAAHSNDSCKIKQLTAIAVAGIKQSTAVAVAGLYC